MSTCQTRTWRRSKGDSHRRIPPFNSVERGSRPTSKETRLWQRQRHASLFRTALIPAVSAATLSNPASTISRLTSKLDPGSRIAPGTDASLRSTSINFVSASSWLPRASRITWLPWFTDFWFLEWKNPIWSLTYCYHWPLLGYDLIKEIAVPRLTFSISISTSFPADWLSFSSRKFSFLFSLDGERRILLGKIISSLFSLFFLKIK